MDALCKSQGLDWSHASEEEKEICNCNVHCFPPLGKPHPQAPPDGQFVAIPFLQAVLLRQKACWEDLQKLKQAQQFAVVEHQLGPEMSCT